MRATRISLTLHPGYVWCMSVTVLITGFGPFPGAPFNPTGALAEQLGRLRRPALADVARRVHVFRTSYAAVDVELPRLIARHAPDVLLLFGLAARTPYLRVETRARNAVSALVPDVGGQLRQTRSIRPGAAAALVGRAPFQKLISVARAARAPVRASRNAGAYLCNYVYWRGIEARPRNKVPLVVFVHVPLVARPSHPRTGRHRLTLDDLVRAGEAILLALVSAARQVSADARLVACHPAPTKRGRD
jgi:pyroglutamyl-peptidase